MNDQQLQQFLAFLQQQMTAQQQAMADLPQRAQQAGATSTTGSGGVILSPDPVRRVQQANEVWRETFPGPVEQARRLGITPEALLASRGNDATNQWAQLGGVVGVDPQKQREMNRAFKQYADFARAQREGTNGQVTEITPASSITPQQPTQPAAPSTPMSGLDIFGSGVASGLGSAARGAGSLIGDYARAVTSGSPEIANAWQSVALNPNTPRAGGAAPSNLTTEQGGWSPLISAFLQAGNAIPNWILGASGTLTEAFTGKDVAPINMQADAWTNYQNMSRGGVTNTPNPQPSASPQMPANPAWAPDMTPDVVPSKSGSTKINPFIDYNAPGMTPESRAQMGTTVGANERNAFVPNQPAQPNFFNQVPAFGQGQLTPMTPAQAQNMFMTEEERKRRQQQQPMMAGR